MLNDFTHHLYDFITLLHLTPAVTKNHSPYQWWQRLLLPAIAHSDQNSWDNITVGNNHDAIVLSWYFKHDRVLSKNMSNSSKHDSVEVEETVKVLLIMYHKDYSCNKNNIYMK